MRTSIKTVFALVLSFAAVQAWAGGTPHNDQNATTTCDSQDHGSCSSDKPDAKKKQTGMAHYSFTSMLASLHLEDTPVAYTPPIGPAIDVTLTYNHREANQPATFTYFNFGPKWNFNWLSYIQDDPTSAGNNVLRYVGGGGARTYTGYNASTGAFAPEENNASVLVMTSSNPVTYELRFPDGSKEVFSQSDGSTAYPRKVLLTQIADPQGNPVSLSYDAQRRLTGITDAIGQTTTLQYGNTSNALLVTGVTDPFGRVVKFAYDTAGRLVSITDAIGMMSSFTYESASSAFVNSMTTPYGTTTFAHTEGVGNSVELSIQATDPNGNTERTEYTHAAPGIPFSEPQAPNMPTFNQYINYRNSFYWDKSAFASACSISNGTTTCDYTKARIKHFLHQAPDYQSTARTLESVKYPNESRIWYYYPNPSGWPGGTGSLDQPTYIGRVLSDGSSQVTRYSYNAQGNRTQAIDPAGRETDYDYAANGIDLVQVRQKTASGFDVIGQWTYNSQHLPLTYTDAAGQTTRYAYNGAGEVTSITNALNQVTTFNYNASDYLTSIVNAAGQTQVSFTYDAIGRVATRTDSEGYVLSYGYDALNRVTSITYPDNTTDTYTYSKLDMVKHVDRLGRATNYTFDAVRNLTSVTDPLNLTVQYGYFQNGELKSLIDAKGNVTQWARDIENRVTSKTYPGGSVWQYNYDQSSRLQSRTDPLGQTRQTAYSIDDRIKSISYLNSVNTTPNVSFVDDAYYPRRTSMSDGSGTTTYTYVPVGTLGANQLQSETAPGANTAVQYSYDQLGRVTGRNVAGAAENFSYDNLGRLSGDSNPLGAFTYGYLGQTNQRTLQLLSGNTLRVDWAYGDNLHDRRLQSITHNGTTGAPDQSYVSIPVTGITQRTDSPTNVVQAYQYDADDRLTQVIRTESSKDCPVTPNNPNRPPSATYSGNCGLHRGQTSANDSEVAVNNIVGPLVQTKSTSTTVTGGGSSGTTTTTSTYTEDAADNLVGINEPTYAYSANVNSDNQITSATANGVAQTFSVDANGNVTRDGNNSYGWDAENRLIKITQTSSNATSVFQYDGLSRRIKQIETAATGSPVETRLLWCGEQICQQRNSSDAVTALYYEQGEQHASNNLYYARDHLGSVIATTDATGNNVLGSAEYTAFGYTMNSTGTQADFGYAGMYRHQPTSLYLTHYRAYDASDTGRWLSRDPIKELGGLNLYAYIRGNPILRIDPSGLQEVIARSSRGINDAMQDVDTDMAQWDLLERIPLPGGPKCHEVCTDDNQSCHTPPKDVVPDPMHRNCYLVCGPDVDAPTGPIEPLRPVINIMGIVSIPVDW